MFGDRGGVVNITPIEYIEQKKCLKGLLWEWGTAHKIKL